MYNIDFVDFEWEDNKVRGDGPKMTLAVKDL